MKTFSPKLFSTFKDYSKSKLVSDIVAGIIVAIIALPLSIALAIASGVGPEKGLYTAIVAGFIIAAFGGSRVNISGPPAAFATIVAGIVATEGLDGLVISTILAGIILILFGILRLGSLIKYIPNTITTGFTAGIAVTIIIGQLKDFLGLTFPAGHTPVESLEKLEAIGASITTFSLAGFLCGALALGILIIWPKISKKIPGSLIVVLLGAVAMVIFRAFPQTAGINIKTIGDLYEITSALPTPSLPKISLERIIHLIPNAFTIALLAAVESLLSCVVSDGMINDRHNSNTELIAQGLGNVCSGIFGGIPATGAIARTAANVKNGGRSPISGMIHAVVLLLVLIVLMPYAAWIPMPVIAAILLMVAYNMSEWRHFVHICKTAPITDTLVLVATFLLTVIFDLVVAIAVGLILTAFLFLKKNADEASVSAIDTHGKTLPDGVCAYEINGPMFFAATDKYLDFTFEDEAKTMIIGMHGVPTLDSSASQSLEKLYRDCCDKNVRLIFFGVNPQPFAVMKKLGLADAIGKESFCSNWDEALEIAKK